MSDRTALAVVMSLALALLPMCSSSHGPPPKLYDPCGSDSDCPAYSGCTPADAAGKRICVSKCSGSNVATLNGQPEPTTCWNGLELPCAQLPTDQTCGCSCPSGNYCAVSQDGTSGHCQPLHAVDATCQMNEECTSGKCYQKDATKAGVCSPPIGAACTDSNCEKCYYVGTPNAWCSADCALHDCPNGANCMTSLATSTSYCITGCDQYDLSCPYGTTCTYFVSSYACAF
jgi:hypothetical protein